MRDRRGMGHSIAIQDGKKKVPRPPPNNRQAVAEDRDPRLVVVIDDTND